MCVYMYIYIYLCIHIYIHTYYICFIHAYAYIYNIYYIYIYINFSFLYLPFSRKDTALVFNILYPRLLWHFEQPLSWVLLLLCLCSWGKADSVVCGPLQVTQSFRLRTISGPCYCALSNDIKERCRYFRAGFEHTTHGPVSSQDNVYKSQNMPEA